jgi:hypothetical protein
MGLMREPWLTDVLERMVSGRTKAHELARLLPCERSATPPWRGQRRVRYAAAAA